MKTALTLLLAFCLASSAHAVDVRIDGVRYVPEVVDAGPAPVLDAGVPPVVDPPPVTVPSGKSKICANTPKVEGWQPRMFSDVVKYGRKWVNTNAGWAEMGDALKPDATGWPTVLPAGSAPTMITAWDKGALSWPAGQYVVKSNGASFTIKTQNGKTLSPSLLGSTITWTPSTDGGLMLVLTKVGGSPPSIRPVGENGTAAPEFIAAVKGMSALRYMDASLTNNSAESASVVPANVASYTTRGITPEAIGALSRETGTDAYVDIPHKATDAYVRDFATRLKATMPADAKVYVEFSNEIWNFQFTQGSFFGASYATASPAYNKRAAQVINLFKQVYGVNAVRVIASQSANYGTATQALDVAKVNGGADALAIAPYFAGDVKTEAGIPASVDLAIKDMVANLAVAKKYGVSLIAYEGMSHLTNVPESVAYSITLGTATRKYLAGWKALDTGVFCAYNLAETGGTGGYWGATQDLRNLSNPKFQALKDAIQ